VPYVDANRVHTYYETDGEGEPLLLLHGGGLSGEAFGPQRRDFAAHHCLYIPDRRAHGRTADIEGPITYEVMADDTIAFMDAVGIDSAHIVGWSDGGNIGMIMAIRRAKRVRALVSIGGNFHFDGLSPELQANIARMTPDTYPLMKRYGELSPDGPEHGAVMLEKIKRLWLSGPTLTTADLAKIAAPTLVVVGDKDVPVIEHTLALFSAVPNAQLCVVPGASHFLLLERAVLVNGIIMDFLAAASRPLSG
jgi:pimeloyl-ACP methyl ester carboxylesterase